MPYDLEVDDEYDVVYEKLSMFEIDDNFSLYYYHDLNVWKVEGYNLEDGSEIVYPIKDLDTDLITKDFTLSLKLYKECKKIIKGDINGTTNTND